MDLDGFLEAFLRYGVDGEHRAPDDVPGDTRERCRAMAARTVTGHPSSSGQMQWRAVRDRLNQISVPTLVIDAEHDGTDVRRTADELARAIPGSRRERVRDAGHQVSLERPEELELIMLSFLGVYDL